MTPEERAQQTLDAHVIHDDWNRKGYQVRALLIEAIEADRAERLAVEPKPLGEGFIMGLREQAAKIEFDGGTAELDHTFGYGGVTLGLTVHVGEATAQQMLNLGPMVKEWVNRVRAEIVTGTSRDVTPGEKENNE